MYIIMTKATTNIPARVDSFESSHTYVPERDPHGILILNMPLVPSE